MSLLSWERGLKLCLKIEKAKRTHVAPFVGAWIEILFLHRAGITPIVAPFVGAWIEMTKKHGERVLAMVAPFVGAWIEICTFM